MDIHHSIIHMGPMVMDHGGPFIPIYIYLAMIHAMVRFHRILWFHEEI